MRWLAATIFATTLAVTGCASAPNTRSQDPPAGGVSTAPAGGQSHSPAAPQCPAQLDEGQAVRKDAKPVPADIQVAWVLRCSVAPQPDGARYLVTERSDGDPAALLAALRRPDEKPVEGACPAIGVVVPYFALIERNGAELIPRLPMSICRQPQSAAMEALRALRFTVVSRTKLP